MSESENYLLNPLNGEFTGRYRLSDDGKVKVAGVVTGHPSDKEILAKIDKEMDEYVWCEDDFLLSTYPKNGTHVLWEAMNMLLRDSAEYLNNSMMDCALGLVPISETLENYNSPRVFTCHYRHDVLPKEFRNRKTVLGIRNPKDVAVSFYHFYAEHVSHPIVLTAYFADVLAHRNKVLSFAYVNPVRPNFCTDSEEVHSYKFTFSDYQNHLMFDKDQPYGTYWDFMDYMWPLAKDNPNILILFFEDLKKDPVKEITRLNEFMGVNRSEELVQQIADAINFKNMQKWKLASKKLNSTPQIAANKGPDAAPMYAVASSVYRKGEVGGWKNKLTVADNEQFDSFLESWNLSKEIPFQYE